MNDFQTLNRSQTAGRADVDVGLRAHMQRVYGLMGVGMVISAIVAWFFGNSDFGLALQTSWMRYVIMFLPLAMVFGFGAAAQRLSYNGARTYFFVFAAAMGASLGWIFRVYTDSSIVSTFLATSVAFLSLSLWGYTTKRDISGWGSFLFIGLVGIIVASLINIFLGSAAIAFAISIIGVLIFAGLTAYDTQNIKNQYLQLRAGGQESAAVHLAIFGALQLYLDFINLFMFLLRFMGNQE